MAKPNQVPEASMEEILASIRKIMSEDETRFAATKPAAAVRREPAPPPPANNVSPLFRDQPVDTPVFAEEDAFRETDEAETPQHDDSAREAIAHGGAPVIEEARPAPVATALDIRAEASAHGWPVAHTEPGVLLSPQANVAVASAFDHLASSILSSNSRTIEQLAEDMIRPMLKNWLDDNLPSLVERLVREEIERVSRRR